MLHPHLPSETREDGSGGDGSEGDVNRVVTFVIFRGLKMDVVNGRHFLSLSLNLTLHHSITTKTHRTCAEISLDPMHLHNRVHPLQDDSYLLLPAISEVVLVLP